MQDAQEARPQVVEAAVGVDQLGVIPERVGHRVDGEVPARQILVDRRRPNLGQRAGARVALGPRLGDVDPLVADREPPREEELVALGLVAGNAGQGLSVALDRDVEVGAVSAQQEIAHDSADEVCRHPLRNRAQRIDARQGLDIIPTHRFTACSRGLCDINRQIDGLDDQPHGTIGQDKIRAAGMLAHIVVEVDPLRIRWMVRNAQDALKRFVTARNHSNPRRVLDARGPLAR